MKGPLVEALGRLNGLVAAAVTATQARASDGEDPYRGLYISDEEVAALLDRPLGELPFNGGRLAGDALPSNLVARFGLSPFEADVLLLAWAPELDLRYERLFAYLHDDVSRRKPSIDLVLTLLCSRAEERLIARRAFDPDRPLRRHHLIELSQDGESELRRTVHLDRAVLGHLMGRDGLDDELAPHARLIAPRPDPHGLDLLPVSSEDRSHLERFLRTATEEGRRRPAVLRLAGPAVKRPYVEMIAATLGVPLLVAAPSVDRRLATRLALDATLRGAALYVEGPSASLPLWEDPPSPCLLLLGDASPRLGPEIRLDEPTSTQRRGWWARQIARADRVVIDGDIAAVAGRFRLGLQEIAAAVVELPNGSDPVPREALFAAARRQCGDTPPLAESVVVRRSWEDLVLPEPALMRLREICQRVEQREHVLETWGFGDKLATGLGTCALFAGPSGTGKTMAAEIVAGELGLPMFRVSLAKVVSKYIGETEKNLDAIFDAAEAANAVAFFDEADALFGKRSGVRDSHDRYANLEISFLLQRMESYAGVAILATNLLQNVDPAFVRRLAFTIHFPFPGVSEREAIWHRVWPDEAPLAEGIDFEKLGRDHKLSGGSIRNAALAAAFLAPPDGAIDATHIEHAVEREYHKLGLRMADELRATA